jgi:hypothetical protein
MPSIPLINLQRAKLAFPNLADNSQDATLNALITAATRHIENYCKRRFGATTYDEIYDSDGTGSLHLRQFPVIDVLRVSMTPTTVIVIKNTDSATNQRA